MCVRKFYQQLIKGYTILMSFLHIHTFASDGLWS